MNMYFTIALIIFFTGVALLCTAAIIYQVRVSQNKLPWDNMIKSLLNAGLGILVIGVVLLIIMMH